VTNPTIRELLEMECQYTEPFVVDGTKIGTALDLRATPYEQTLADTLATYRPRPAPHPRRFRLPHLGHA
jgi:hypothetical protein